MASWTTGQNFILNKLVTDCITFGLKTKEALKYIEIEFGQPYPERSYTRRRAKLQSEDTSNLWLNYFTRIGFLQQHRKLMDDIQKIHDDSLNRYFYESIKSREERNEDLILKLKADIRENAKLLAEFTLSTPIISAIKQKLREKDQKDGIQVLSGR